MLLKLRRIAKTLGAIFFILCSQMSHPCLRDLQFVLERANSAVMSKLIRESQPEISDDFLKSLQGAGDSRFVATQTGFGFMMTVVDLQARIFEQWSQASLVKGPLLDIGASYGITTHHFLNSGRDVIANDLDSRQLLIAAKRTDPKKLAKLILHQGQLAADLSFAENSIAGIHVSRVMHFLNPTQFQKALNDMYRWLKPGGRLMVTTETPFNGNLQKNGFNAIYEKRLQDQNPWPGFIEDIRPYYPTRGEHLPLSMNFMTPEILKREFEAAGFRVVITEYIDRRHDFPPDVLFRGRESCAIFAEKP